MVSVGESGTPFNCHHPETWAVEYEFGGYLDNCVVHYLDTLAGDLAAAAMRFQTTSTDGNPCDYAKAFKDLKHESSKLRKITGAQAEAGGAGAAIEWVVKFDSILDVPEGENTDLGSKNLARDSKIEAGLGIVEGILQRVKGGRRTSPDDWYEHW